jgi:hypothetical protein
MKRIHIRNATHFIEWSDTNTGEMQARAFRKHHREFKRRKIRRVLQLMPSQVPCGVVMELA